MPFIYTHPPTLSYYTLSLHDALPIYFFPGFLRREDGGVGAEEEFAGVVAVEDGDGSAIDELVVGAAVDEDDAAVDRKSTRLNSSHANISYAVFCLKKKKKNNTEYSSP